MLFSPDTLVPTGPPPQSVLEQRLLWQVLLALLGLTLVLRLIGLDLAGALFTAIMLYVGVVMTRDGMEEIAKYVVLYAMLCGLCLFFDLLPLIAEIGGRVSETQEPIYSKTQDGSQVTTYKQTTQTTPFFDASQGFLYNVQSCAMIASPISMALGWYLAVSAHSDMLRLSPELVQGTAGPAWAGHGGLAAGGFPGWEPRGTVESLSARTSAAREERFQGQAHTLE